MFNGLLYRTFSYGVMYVTITLHVLIGFCTAAVDLRSQQCNVDMLRSELNSSIGGQIHQTTQVAVGTTEAQSVGILVCRLAWKFPFCFSITVR